MSVGSLLRNSYLLYFSQPAADRALYKALSGRPVRSIVELGISLGERTTRLLEVASWRSDCLPLRYTGIDLFEGRAPGLPRLTLKQAHGALRLPNVRVQLVPGDPHAALARVANSLAGTDLLIVDARQDRESLELAWNWVPRMVSPQTLLFVEQPSGKAGSEWRCVPHAEVQKLALQAGKLLRRAA